MNNQASWIKILCVILLIVSSSASVNAIDTPIKVNNTPIKILLNDWTSQIVLSHIAGEVFQRQGYFVSYVPSEVSGQWFLLKSRSANVQLEVWEGSMSDKYYQLRDDNALVDAGNHGAVTREDWWYPAYVEEQCPGLPDWEALNRCHKLFVDSRTHPLGMYLGGPWEKPDRARIRALNLKFKLVEMQSSEELRLELARSILNRKPIVLFNWSPNSTDARVEGAFVEFPDYNIACENDPSWGISKQFPWDCGNPKSGWLKKVASTDFPVRWRCAFAALKNINFDNKMIAELAAWVDMDHLSYEEAASKWLENNRQLWSSWIPRNCSD